MPTKESWLDITPEQQDELATWIVLPGYRIVKGTDLPSVIPDGIRLKIDSALVIADHSSTGGMYVVFSNNRIDKKDKANDIEPMGVLIHSTGPSPKVVFLHHGDWKGRTTALTPEHLESGSCDYFYHNPHDGQLSGPLDDLPEGHRGAFHRTIAAIRADVDKWRFSGRGEQGRYATASCA